MASTWKNRYVVASLEKGLADKFSQQIHHESHISLFLKMLIEKLRGAASFKACVQSFISGWEFILLTNLEETNRNQVELYADCLCEASRHILLTGEWMQQQSVTKDYLLENMNKCGRVLVSRKDEINRVWSLVKDPWGSPRVRSLLNGKMEQQQQVLELVSSEGVDLVLLRIEMLIESRMDRSAYKFVAAVANSLLADHIVFQSYVSTSSPGSLERIVDIFLALAVATLHETRVMKLMKHVGQETLHSVYMKRFKAYLTMDHDPEEEKASHEGQAATQEQAMEVKEERGEEEQEDSRLFLCEKGRCTRLFTQTVCLKVLGVFLKYSLSVASVKECSWDRQQELVTSWLDKFGEKKEKLLEDVDVLMETANQSSFLYTLAFHLWHKFGKEVEERCLRMFIHGLTNDMNAQEAAKKNKQLKHKIEERMVRGYWLLSQLVHDRVSLARECVLTAFSIKPSQELLNKIREMAAISRLDKITDDEPDLDDSLTEMKEVKTGLHCRVTLGEEGKAAQVFTKLHMANMMKHLSSAPSAAENFQRMVGLADSEDIFADTVGRLTESLERAAFARAATKLRSNKTRHKKKFRNLEGILAIQGELITEAANYNPIDEPCKSLNPENLGLSRQITDDLLIVISAPRWHLLSWVIAWSELEQTCIKLLKDPSLREPNEELKYLNIDYTQFDEWSSDEEVTIYTGIEKGYERWLQHPSDSHKFNEDGLSSDEEGISFKTEHTIEREDYEDLDKYIGHVDYLPEAVAETRPSPPAAQPLPAAAVPSPATLVSTVKEEVTSNMSKNSESTVKLESSLTAHMESDTTAMTESSDATLASSELSVGNSETTTTAAPSESSTAAPSEMVATAPNESSSSESATAIKSESTEASSESAASETSCESSTMAPLESSAIASSESTNENPSKMSSTGAPGESKADNSESSAPTHSSPVASPISSSAAVTNASSTEIPPSPPRKAEESAEKDAESREPIQNGESEEGMEITDDVRDEFCRDSPAGNQ